MKTKDWLIVIATFIFTLIVDQASKHWFFSQPETWIGPIHLIKVENHGAMLGSFSNLPAFLRIVTLSTSGFFLLSIYIFVQYLIPIRLLGLRVGLSFLIGGIMGNVLDRTFYSYVFDFISVKIGAWHSPIWNVADMIQWVGYFLVTWNLIKKGHLLWPEENSRKTFWVNRRFQIKYAAIFIFSGLFISLISMVFSYTYLRITLAELHGQQNELISKYSEPYLTSFVFLVLTFVFTLFMIAKYLSHRTAGPIYAFERFLNDILEGRGLTKSGPALKLRAGDDFKHLEDLAEEVKRKLQSLNSEKTISVVELPEDSNQD